MITRSFTSKIILQQLDKCAQEYAFPTLDNGHIYLADTRMSLYRDKKRWAIIIQVLGFTPRGIGIGGIQNCLYCFGNCLKRKPGMNNQDFLFPIADGPSGPLFDDEFGEVVNEGASDLRIRDTVVQVPKGLELFQEKGIVLEEPPSVFAFELFRALIPEYQDNLLATEKELRERIPANLPLILQLDDWFHPDLVAGELPSENPTFKSLAKVLVTGNTEHYAPKEPSNTHWTNWPEGGTL